MNFYENRQKTIKFIENLIKNEGKIDKNQLIYNVQKQSGFSERFVNKQLELLFNLNLIKFEENFIIWV